MWQCFETLFQGLRFESALGGHNFALGGNLELTWKRKNKLVCIHAMTIVVLENGQGPDRQSWLLWVEGDLRKTSDPYPAKVLRVDGWFGL